MCIMMHDIQTKKGISGYGLKSKGQSVDINKKCTAYENEVYLIYINFALFYNTSNYVIYKRLSKLNRNL